MVGNFLSMKIDHDIITLVNIYAPNNENCRVDFFKRMQTFINQHSLNIKNVLLCGDFNCTSNKTSDKSTVKLNAVCKNIDLIDVWSEKHGNMTGYTWCDGENVPKSRIDYMFLSKDFIYDVKQIIVRKIPGTHSNGSRMSDHRALKCTFYLSHNEKGSGYWKLNTSYLVKDIIQNVKEDIDGSHLYKWETLKYNVKTFFTSVC